MRFDNDGTLPLFSAAVCAFDRFYCADSGSVEVDMVPSKKHIELFGDEMEIMAMSFGMRLRVGL